MTSKGISDEARLWRDVNRVWVAHEDSEDASVPDFPEQLLAALARTGLTLVSDRGRRTARRVLALRFDR